MLKDSTKDIPFEAKFKLIPHQIDRGEEKSSNTLPSVNISRLPPSAYYLGFDRCEFATWDWVNEEEGCLAMTALLNMNAPLNYRAILRHINAKGDVFDYGRGRKLRKMLDDLEKGYILLSNGVKSGLRKFYSLAPNGRALALMCMAVLTSFNHEDYELIRQLEEKIAWRNKICSLNGAACTSPNPVKSVISDWAEPRKTGSNPVKSKASDWVRSRKLPPRRRRWEQISQ